MNTADPKLIHKTRLVRPGGFCSPKAEGRVSLGRGTGEEYVCSDGHWRRVDKLILAPPS